MTEEKDINIFNTIALHERVLKNQVTNLKGASIDLVPLDEKKKLNQYSKHYSADGYKIEFKFPELKNYERIKTVPCTGLGPFCKEVRGYLANGVYVGVDMINCHPVILQHVFKREGIDCIIIDSYIKNRKEFLEAEQCVKEDFLKLINKKKYEGTGTL